MRWVKKGASVERRRVGEGRRGLANPTRSPSSEGDTVGPLSGRISATPLDNVSVIISNSKYCGVESISGSMPAIHAMRDGYDVHLVTDASGGVSSEAHDMAIRRLVAAGAQPITWLGMAGELQRD